jgi:DNA-binding PadR family transcriptional regulator
MAICFVIQPFDDSAYDKRYDDVLKPAIEAADLEAYRVDEDPSVNIPIDEIERGIRESSVCLAEITTNNPNVWFELGFAIASRKEVVLICTDNRGPKFPFDVQHRNIIIYKTDSPQDFDALRKKITERLLAILRKEERLGQLVSPIVDVEGLSQHEMVALVSLAENLESPSHFVGTYQIRQDMERAGFARVATFIALTSLSRKGLVTAEEDSDQNGNTFMIYRLTLAGVDWLMKNQDKLVLREEPRTAWPNPFSGSADDDIQF